jgi:omega-amidase
VRAHLVQLDIAWEDKPRNYARTTALLRAAGVRRGDLVVLPEMFDTGFSFDLPKTNDADGQTLRYLQNLAVELGVTVQGARTVLGPDDRGRNRATVCAPNGEVLVEYDKIHPFSYGRESEFFSGGDRVMTYTWTQGAAASVAHGGTNGVPPDNGEDAAVVCPAICYDLRFPELFRRGLLAGAEIFAVGANWPVTRAMHRRTLTIARAIENQAYVLGVNRAGADPHLDYRGGSLVVGPTGEVVAELGEAEGVLTVDIDLAALRAWRTKFPAWKDHRLIGVEVARSAQPS